MGDTWRATLDPRAISALFLLVESRYHQIKLPKPPREAVQDGKGGAHGVPRRGEPGGTAGALPKKATAQFRKISSLTPLCTGVNLRVKVVEPIKTEVRVLASGFLPDMGGETPVHDGVGRFYSFPFQADLVLPRGQVIKRGTMVVGDDEAIITLK